MCDQRGEAGLADRGGVGVTEDNDGTRVMIDQDEARGTREPSRA